MSEGLKKCGNCKELITEDYIHCDGISFHREHFTCNFCDLELGGKHYYKKENKYYCENDYFNVYGHICNYCAYPIKEEGIEILSLSYHIDHLLCEKCLKPLFVRSDLTSIGNLRLKIRDTCNVCEQKLYHKHCFSCAICTQLIYSDDWITEEGKPVHSSCSSGIREGEKALEGPKPKLQEEEAITEAVICAKCMLPCNQQYFEFKDKIFHIDCFECSKCGISLRDKDLVSMDDSLFCSVCGNLPKCNHCGVEITEDYLIANEKYYHKEHLICSFCNTFIHNREFFIADGELMCENCQHNKYEKVGEAGEEPPEAITGVEAALDRTSGVGNKEYLKHGTTIEEEEEGEDSTPMASNEKGDKREDLFMVSNRQEGETQKDDGPVSIGMIDQSERVSEPKGEYFPLKELQSKPYPISVDSTKREMYLSDSDFKGVFGMDKVMFYTLPQWKILSLKKQNNLF